MKIVRATKEVKVKATINTITIITTITGIKAKPTSLIIIMVRVGVDGQVKEASMR